MRRYITDITHDTISPIEITHETDQTVFTACGEIQKRLANTAVHETWEAAREHLLYYHRGRATMYRMFLDEHNARIYAIKKLQEP